MLWYFSFLSATHTCDYLHNNEVKIIPYIHKKRFYFFFVILYTVIGK